METTTKLVKWNEMKQAVAECYRVDEIALIRNKAEAYRYALRQAKESPEVIRKAEEIKLRAERRAGELLYDMKGSGQRHSGYGDQKTESQAATPKLSDLGITKNQSSKWQRIASIPEERFEEFVAREKEITTAGAVSLALNLEREKRREETIQPELNKENKYRIIYADPPWPYRANFMDNYGHAGAHYNTMTIKEICDLPIKDLTEDDAVLFLWVTSPKLMQANEVIEAWGFCVGVGTRVLTDDLRWVAAESLSVGDPLLAFDEHLVPARNGRAGRRRYFRKGRVLSTGTEIADIYEIKLQDGRTLTCTPNHAWLVKKTTSGLDRAMRWLRTDEMAKYMEHHARKSPIRLVQLTPVIEPEISCGMRLFDTKEVRIMRVRPRGKGPIVSLMTDTGTYIAEGFGAHNTYKTSFVWDKILHNFGYYNSVRHELLLVAGRGRSTPDVKKLHDSVVSIKRSSIHSEKPDYFRELIDRLYTHGRRIELFARKRVEGWDVWGAEV